MSDLPPGWVEVVPPDTSAVDSRRPTREQLLHELKAANATRRRHRRRAANASRAYRDALFDPSVSVDQQNHMHLRLWRAQETSRGSRIFARRAHEAWERARREPDAADFAAAHALFNRLTENEKRRAAYDFFFMGGMQLEQLDDGTVRRVPPDEWKGVP